MYTVHKRTENRFFGSENKTAEYAGTYVFYHNNVVCTTRRVTMRDPNRSNFVMIKEQTSFLSLLLSHAGGIRYSYFSTPHPSVSLNIPSSTPHTLISYRIHFSFTFIFLSYSFTADFPLLLFHIFS